MNDQTGNISEQLLQQAFDINRYAWREASFDTTLIEYHFFTEIYEISLSENKLDKHPEAREFLVLFPRAFVKLKFTKASYSFAYNQRRLAFHELLNAQPQENQLSIRRHAIYEMHVVLMTRDFGGLFCSFGSECQGLTKEAEDFIASQASV